MSGWKVWHGKRVQQQVRRAATEATRKAVEAAGMVMDQQVPHDEGILQGSKTIKVDDASGKVAIGYGGGPGTGHPLVPYALKWHETPANFQKGRKHNYVRDPARSELPRNMMFELRKTGMK